MGNKWTENQLKVINSRGSNLLVSAAAGSGKTAVLIERIIKLILDEDNPIDIDRLLVVTFTNAAANEMRERVGQAIEKALLKDPENQRLQEQILLLNKADITTIDSFCKKIIKNNFHAINIDPAISIADEAEVSIIQSEVLEELFDDLYSQEDQDFLMLVEAYSSKRDDSSLANLILMINNFLGSTPFPYKWMEEASEFFNTATKSEDFFIENYIGKFLDKSKSKLILTKNILEKEIDELSFYSELDSYRINNFQILEAVEIILDLINRYKTENDIKIINQIREKIDEFEVLMGQLKFRISSKADESVKETYKVAKSKIDPSVKDLREELKNISLDTDIIRSESDLIYPYMRALSDLTKKFRQAYAEKKKSLALMDFSDIEHFALQILAKEDEDGNIIPSDIAISYQNYYEEIFTDEYQDSNLVQETILSLIARKDCPNRFMVGDVKQSIYKFRQSMPEIFMEKYDRYALYNQDKREKEEKILLYNNFRSRAEVLEACNYIFSQIMRISTGELDYTDEERLNPSAIFSQDYPENASIGGPVEVYLVDTKDEDTNEEESIVQDSLGDLSFEDAEKFELESMKISLLISSLVNTSKPFMIFDKDIDQYRPCQYRDIVILLRAANAKGPILEETLKAYSIPVYSNTGQGFYSTLEIDLLINLLKIIDNPMQDIELLAVMRSPIFNFTSNDLAKIRIFDKNASIYQILNQICRKEIEKEEFKNEEFEKEVKQEDKISEIKLENGLEDSLSDSEISLDEELDSKVAYFLEKINLYKSKSIAVSIDELIWFILKDTGYYIYVGQQDMGSQKQANLLLFFEKARQFEKSSYKGLFSFLNYIERVKLKSKEPTEAKTISADANNVNIMSIHKSKGLEFPVVIVADMGKEFFIRSNDSRLTLHQTMGYGPNVIDIKKRVSFPSLRKSMIENKYRNESLAEEMRLLYVAMTRAKEKLIFTSSVKDINKKMEYWENAAKNEHGALDDAYVLASKNYLDWIMPNIINLEKKDKFLNVMKEEVVYKGFESNKWYIDVEKSKDVFDKYNENTLSTDETQNLRLGSNNVLLDENEEAYIKDKLNFKYKYFNSMNKASSISVSEIKKLIEDANQGEMHENIYSKIRVSDLRSPKFVHSGEKKIEFSSAERGTIFHLLMQVLDFSKFKKFLFNQQISFDLLNNTENKDVEIRDEIKSQIKDLVSRSILTKDEAKTINIDWVMRFVKSPIFLDIIEAENRGKLYREKAINYNIKIKDIYKDQDIEDTEKMMMVGIVDLFFEDVDGNLILLDYKTDYVDQNNKDEVLKRYDSQLEYYQKALEDISGKKVKAKYIYLMSIGELVEYKEK